MPAPEEARSRMAQAAEPGPARPVGEVLRDPGYLRLLLLATVLGVPLSLVAFGFLALEHAAQNGLWEHLPHHLGYAVAPWWWPLPLLAVGGLLVAWVVTRLPGAGGHVPARGLNASATEPSALPGVVLAGLASLAFGAVLGPEAPLMAIGSGLALLAVHSARRAGSPQLVAVLGAAGSATTISTVFGSPLVAAVLIIEAAGLGGPGLLALILPSLLASGVGALVLTGFGRWTGLDTGGLALPSVPPDDPLEAGDFLWGVPLAVVIAVVVRGAVALGGRVADWTAKHPGPRTALCAVVVGAALAAYGLCTGRSPEEAALSGQATLAELAADPGAWPISVLLWLLLFKGLAWSVSLGALRGGPIFPALLVGPVLALVFAGLPGFGVTTALAVGIVSAAAAVTRLPVTASVLATLLLGRDAPEQMAVVLVCAVVAFATGELLRSRRRHGTSADAAPSPRG
ncbi:chloride channel protein [Streptomyces sp. NPDC005955]|uniref:chloride channel protein n=1 Tax=Streptomyces sp. NPDC005955 TaxID=3364738 RepID=UPI0036AEB5F8